MIPPEAMSGGYSYNGLLPNLVCGRDVSMSSTLTTLEARSCRKTWSWNSPLPQGPQQHHGIIKPFLSGPGEKVSLTSDWLSRRCWMAFSDDASKAQEASFNTTENSHNSVSKYQFILGKPCARAMTCNI